MQKKNQLKRNLEKMEAKKGHYSFNVSVELPLKDYFLFFKIAAAISVNPSPPRWLLT